MSFSDPGNWYNSAADPQNPSGPPGASDTATLQSGAAVTASGASVSQLNGVGTATLTLNGPFSAQTVAGGGMTLNGSGMLTAQSVSSLVTIVGGHLTATSYSARSLSVDSSGSLKIIGSVQSPGPSQSFLFNAVGGSTLEIQGAANDVDGGIEGGAHATLAGIANLNDSQSTLDVNGSGTLVTISGSSSFRNNSFDIASGAGVTLNSSLSFQGANSSGTSTSASSFWQGAGTTVTIGNGLTVGKGTGDYNLQLRSGVQVASSGGIILGSDSGGSGTLTMSDGASVELGSATMVVGQLGQGTVTMDSLSSIHAGTIAIGRSTSNNQFTAGQDTIIGVLNEMVVGDGGHGTLHFTAGAQAVVKRLVVGRSSQSDNNAIVEGVGTTLSGSGRIDVGESNGRGTFEIRSSAQAQPNGGLSVGIYDGSTGALSIHDSAQINTGSAAIIGGGASSQATATLFSGGQLTALDVLIFAKPGGTSTVKLLGSLTDPRPTLLFALDEVQVGFTHDAAGSTSLQVTNSAYLDAGSLLVAGNNGVFDVRGGSAKVGDADFPPNGTVRIGTNGVLAGPGTIIGKVEVANRGNVAPGSSPGILNIQGNYQMNAGSQLSIEIAGTSVGTNYDSVHATGTAVVAGTLAISFINGFSPRSGQVYTFLQAPGGITGSFTNVQVTGVAPGFSYHIVSNVAGSLSLQADSNGTATSAPLLQISRSGNSITLAWPAPGTWLLQSSTNLLSGWTAVSGTPTTQSNQYVLTVPMSQSRTFFRLAP